MGESYNGLTEEEFDAMYPKAAEQGTGNESDNQSQTDDVEGDRHTPADFDNGTGHTDETIHSGESPKPGFDDQDQQQEADRPPANLKGEYYRKKEELETLETKLQSQGILERPQQESKPLSPVPNSEFPPELPQQTQQQYGQSGTQQSVQQQELPFPETAEEWPAYLRQREEKSEQRAEQKAEQRAMQVVQQQQTEQRILSDYPDMMNPQSPLFQWTQYELNTRYGNDSRFVEEATMRAAARCNVRAKSIQTGQTQAVSTNPKPLPRTSAPTSVSERGTLQQKQGSKVKLSEESLKAAKAFGQNPKELEAMVKKQKYAFFTGENLFTED